MSRFQSAIAPTPDENSAPEIPADMREVSETEFFARLKADSRDIMPRLADPNFTSWETNDHRQQAWGWTTPGWKNPGAAKHYAVVGP